MATNLGSNSSPIKREFIPGHQYEKFFIVGSGAFALLILAVVYGLTVQTLTALAAPESSDEFVIEMVSRQEGEAHYPNQAVITTNEVHIPVNEPIILQVTAPEVIPSLWAPKLHGKVDLIPDQTNVIWLQADKPGLFESLE